MLGVERLSTDSRSRPVPTPEPGAARRSRWSLLHRHEASLRQLLSANPVLLLSDPRPSERVAELVARWNPEATTDVDGVPLLAEGIRWRGPIALSPSTDDSGDVTDCWSIAYVAELSGARRASAPDVAAWHLVRGLARILRGTARMPRSAGYPHEPRACELAVYGHDPLPCRVLREVLRIAVPDIELSAMTAADDYVLAELGLFAVRAGRCDPCDPLPYALRPRADDTWPHAVYRFSADTRRSDPPTALRARRRLTRCAVLLADVVDGRLIDGDGFPIDDLDPELDQPADCA
jgi:hypothetical protein